MDASIFGIGINIPEAEIVEFKLASERWQEDETIQKKPALQRSTGGMVSGKQEMCVYQ